MKKAVVLLSGGMDSSTCAAIAASQGFRLYAMTFDYGQRHKVELQSARAVAEFLQVAEHRVVAIDLRAFGGSALTDAIPVPKGRHVPEQAHDIPLTYVPARNTIFLSYALGWAEVLGSLDLFVGVNAVDYSGYPDCRPEYIRAFQSMANLATRAGVEGHHLTIHTPLIDKAKHETIEIGTQLRLDYALTHSCYDPAEDGRACGQCDACTIRKRGFAAAGVKDPTRYQK